MKRLLVILPLLFLNSGCVQTRFKMVDGTEFSTTRILWQGDIGHAQIGNSNGVSASIDAYHSDAAAIANAISAGVAQGVVKGLKP